MKSTPCIRKKDFTFPFLSRKPIRAFID
jgi:hypothetical protein